MRKILHVDMDAFYASVEQRDRPELRGKPVVVAWEAQRSVVCAASYEARKFGVRSAMPAMRARRLCPEAVFVRPDFERYRAVSRTVREIFLRHTPLVEPLSLDEAYLDVTAELTGLPTATATAEAVRAEIRAETALTASAGVAPNKFLAKIASDWRKPDGLFVIKPHQVLAFLAPLPVGRLPGVGKATEEALAAEGIRRVGDVRRRDPADLARRFGKFGERLFALAHGIDDSAVVPDRPRKSISSETTFDTDLPLEGLEPTLRTQAQAVFAYMTKQRRVGRTVTVKLRTRDFRTITRRLTPAEPPASGDAVLAVALDLLRRLEAAPGARFRLCGVGLSNFLDEAAEDAEGAPQPALFDPAGSGGESRTAAAPVESAEEETP